MFVHTIQNSYWMNPRVTWCYEFESAIGDMVGCAKSCLAGTSMQRIGSKVIDSYLLVVQISLR